MASDHAMDGRRLHEMARQWVNPDGTVAPAGLQVPDSVRVTSNKYFEAEDILTQWLEECTEADPNSVIRTTDLFLCWRGWCEIRMQRVGSEKAFTAAMDAKAEKRKFQRGQNRAHQSVYTGIKLRPNVPKFDAGHRHQSARDQDEMPWSEE
jgi:phage/plasmid-associated DNA primase